MANIGFIGTGIMGKPMAGHLLAAGHTLHVYDIDPAPLEELAAKGAVKCSSSKEVAEKSDVVFLIVPDTPDVEAVLFGKDGAAEGLSSGNTLVDMSSISPVATKKIAVRLEEQGVEMLDAPVSGGQIGAEQASLTIMVGGKEQTFSAIKPYFELMGKSVNLVGGNGDGQTAKVSNQIIVALTLEAVGEALLFASKMGANPENVRQALLGGFAQSRILEVHGERMIKRTFDPGFRIRHQQKDLNNALSAARELGLSLPGTALAQELYNSINSDGGADKDHSSLITALEKMANHTIG
jgi:2-hydroxy-3-oxopropionate reductase